MYNFIMQMLLSLAVVLHKFNEYIKKKKLRVLTIGMRIWLFLACYSHNVDNISIMVILMIFFFVFVSLLVFMEHNFCFWRIIECEILMKLENWLVGDILYIYHVMLLPWNLRVQLILLEYNFTFIFFLFFVSGQLPSKPNKYSIWYGSLRRIKF